MSRVMAARVSGIVAALLLTASTAAAQDLPTTQLEDHAAVVRQGTLTRSLLNRRTSTASFRARTTCGNKRRAATRLRPNHPSVRRLYALCARAGY